MAQTDGTVMAIPRQYAIWGLEQRIKTRTNNRQSHTINTRYCYLLKNNGEHEATCFGS